MKIKRFHAVICFVLMTLSMIAWAEDSQPSSSEHVAVDDGGNLKLVPADQVKTTPSMPAPNSYAPMPGGSVTDSTSVAVPGQQKPGGNSSGMPDAAGQMPKGGSSGY